MNYYRALTDQFSDLESSETSYFGNVAEDLDPRLFSGDKLKPSVRNSILSLVLTTLNAKFHGAESWTHVWLAGSGVSYLWQGHRDPADLDCLLGIDYGKSRQMNTGYAGLSNGEIAAEVNALLSAQLHPKTGNYLGVFDLTFYANVKSDIRDIKPYAAYSLTDDRWVVEPRKAPVSRRPEWDAVARRDTDRARKILEEYGQHLTSLKTAPHEAAKRNAEIGMYRAAYKGSELFDEIHEARKEAFGSMGEGYEDFTNYRWQAGKASGVVSSMKRMKEALKSAAANQNLELYGIDLPDANILIRRAALQYTESRKND